MMIIIIIIISLTLAGSSVRAVPSDYHRQHFT
jgi:hypothetical protein